MYANTCQLCFFHCNNSGLRSGEITPKSLASSRPGSAMSTSTTNSSVNRRTTPVRKAQRPLSIHVTGVSKEGELSSYKSPPLKIPSTRLKAL